MTHPIELARSRAGITLLLRAVRAGPDLAVMLTGGPEEAPERGAHIGCVCLGIPRPSLRGDGSRSATVSTLNVTGHKDDELGNLIALRLASLTGGVCAVTAGLHVDKADEAALESIRGLALELLGELEGRIEEPGHGNPAGSPG